jgi:AraC-like DNA-binding protein
MNGIITVRQTAFADFEALHDAMQDAPSEVVQLEPGKMTGSLTHLSIGSVGISTGSFTRGLRARGILSERRWMLGMRVLGDPVLYQHVEVAPGDLMLVKPDHEHFARYFGVNHYAATFIEPDELFAFLENQQPGAADAAVWHQSVSVLTADPAIATTRVGKVQTLIAALTRHGATMSADTADFYKRCILALMTAPVLDGVSYRGPRLQLSKVQLVQEVDRYLVAAGNRPVHISELSEVFKVNRRMLHRAFIEAVGIPPITFLRRKRLGDVHAVLLTGRPHLLIKAVAIEHGFLELGRFAGEYRKLFGEKPSETLRRSIRP